MAKLVSVKDFREAMNFPDSDQVNKCVAKALDSATLYIEAELRTKLSKVAGNVDKFPYSEYVEKAKANARSSLYLKNGFVDAASVVVSISDTLFPSGTSVNLASDLQSINAEKGLAYLDVANITESGFINVTYDSGFTEDIQGVLSGTPAWLVEAGIFMARELYRTDDEEVPFSGDLGVNKLLQPHVRLYGFTLYPMA